MFGFIIGLWADSFQKLQAIPLMIVTPLTFLGGAFYSINMLPPFWQKVTLFNPVVYLISGMRWAFYGTSDVNVAISIGMTLGFLVVCLDGDLVDLQDRLQAQVVKRALDVLGQRRLERQARAGHRMIERERRGVQRLAAELRRDRGELRASRGLWP